MNRLTIWVHRHPARSSSRSSRVVVPLTLGDVPAHATRSNYINLFRPETRVVRDYHTVESKLGGIGLVELVVPVGQAIDADGARQVRRRIDGGRLADAGRRPARSSQVISLATVLDPDGRLAALPAEAPGADPRRPSST